MRAEHEKLLEEKLEAQRGEMQALLDKQRREFETERGKMEAERRQKEEVQATRARDMKERHDKVEAERKAKLRAARELRAARQQDEQVPFFIHKKT